MKMKLNEEHLGTEATREEALTMVEKLQMRGYDVEYGFPNETDGENLRAIPDDVWQEVLSEVVLKTGYCAVNQHNGDRYDASFCGPIRDTDEQAEQDRRDGGYDCTRWVGADGYLYVDRQD